MSFTIMKGHSLDLIEGFGREIDLVVTDPPYAFGGNGAEHAVSATVATVLREVAQRTRRGSWMIVLCASSWRSINYMVESVRGVMEPVRVATWVKPTSKSKVRTAGWRWASVTAVAMRKGPKNRADLVDGSEFLDHISEPALVSGRRAQLPCSVSEWAVSPFVVPGGVFLDPFSGSGALPNAASLAGMQAFGFELDPPSGAEHAIDCDMDLDCVGCVEAAS